MSDHNDIFFPRFLFSLQQLHLHNCIYKSNSLKGKFPFSCILPQLGNSLGSPKIILLKFRSKTNHNIFAIILTQPASQLDACQKITHTQLSVPPHHFENVFSRKHASVDINMIIQHQARHRGNMQPFARRETWMWEKKLYICLQMHNTAHGFGENFLLQHSVTGQASWGMPELKRLPNKH